MADPIKLAIIGCGGIAGAHLDGYQRLAQAGYDKFRIDTLCETNPEKLAAFVDRAEKALGYRPIAFTKVSDMLADARLDAADICLPHAYHHSAAIPCLEKGMHVMVEKPCGITVKATQKIMEAAAELGHDVAAPIWNMVVDEKIREDSRKDWYWDI